MDLIFQVNILDILDKIRTLTQRLLNEPMVEMVLSNLDLLTVMVLLCAVLILRIVNRRLSSYKTLLDISSLPTIVIDVKNGRIRYSNHALNNLFNQSSEASDDRKEVAGAAVGNTLVESSSADPADGSSTVEDSSIDATGLIAKHCYLLLSPLTQTDRVENEIFHIKELKKNLRLSAVKIKFQRRESWLCQLDDIGMKNHHSPSWDIEHQMLAELLESSSALIYVKSCNGLILNCSPGWAKQFNKTVADVVGSNESELFSSAKMQHIQSYEHGVLAGKVQEYEEWSLQGEQNILLHTIKSPLFDEHNNVVAVLTVSNDLTEVMELNERLLDENSDHLRIEAELSRYNSLLNSVINAAPDPIAFMNSEGRYVGGNQTYCDVWGVSHSELIGMNRRDLLPADQLGWQIEQDNALLIDGNSVRYEELVHITDETTRWYEVFKHRYMNSANGECGILIIYRDLTERKQIELELETAVEKFDKLSSTDELTKIANRRTFDQKLRHYWTTHRREVKEISLLFCDVDAFKLYNDNYGHQQGDQVLEKVALAMTEQVSRGTDLVARYGGEEFAIILPNTRVEGAKLIASQILEGVAEMKIPHDYSPAKSVVTVSIGIATMQPEDNISEQVLIEKADNALYQAKENGRNQYFVFTDEKEEFANIALNFELNEP